MIRAVSHFQLTARGHDRVRRVERTLADLGGSDSVSSSHIVEALSYRGRRSDE